MTASKRMSWMRLIVAHERCSRVYKHNQHPDVFKHVARRQTGSAIRLSAWCRHLNLSEQAKIYRLEHDPDVIEFYDQSHFVAYLNELKSLLRKPEGRSER
jgi:hypothetical protein